MHSDLELLHHMYDELKYLINESRNTNEEKFLKNETLKRAFSRSLEIIGEAVKNISNEFILKHRNIEWRSMAGMRDKLIHGYFSIDYSIVWDVVEKKIPTIYIEIDEIIKTEKRDNNSLL
jgi:uncharacterized protein with HEPN domain